jgi:tetratricopeptide (TPR) repeat protein
MSVSQNDIWLMPLQSMLMMLESRVDEAVDLIHKAIRLHNHPLSYGRAGWVFNLLGEYEKAIHIIEEGLNKFSIRRAANIAWLATAYYKNGNQDKAMEIFGELEKNIESNLPNQAFFTGVAYAFIGKNEDAFRLLEKSYQLRDLDFLWIKEEPMLNSLRNEPRYLELLSKIVYE